MLEIVIGLFELVRVRVFSRTYFLRFSRRVCSRRISCSRAVFSFFRLVVRVFFSFRIRFLVKVSLFCSGSERWVTFNISIFIYTFCRIDIWSDSDSDEKFGG